VRTYLRKKKSQKSAGGVTQGVVLGLNPSTKKKIRTYQWRSILLEFCCFRNLELLAFSLMVYTSSGPLAIQVDPQMQIVGKINENWHLYLIMQASAMCLQQIFFLWRVIILSVPI
jgi:hypothetical protein